MRASILAILILGGIVLNIKAQFSYTLIPQHYYKYNFLST